MKSKASKILSLVFIILLLTGTTTATAFSMGTTSDGFSYYVSDGNVEIRGYVGTADEIAIPSTIDEMPVTGIGSYALHDLTNLKSIYLPDSISYIESGAFSGCTNLEKINIPHKITQISSFTFCDCENLKEIAIPKAVTAIGRYAFASCESLESIELPKGISHIEEWTFFGCASLTDISIPCGVVSIGSHAFSSCNNLKNISLPNGILSLGESSFDMCSSLIHISIPESVSSIGEYALARCHSLASISIPETLTVIDDNALFNTNNLEHIIYSGSIDKFKQISIGVGNDILHTTHKHYDTSADVLTTEIVESTCTSQGYTLHGCLLCEFSYKTNTADYIEHSFSDGTCISCGALKADLIESEHNYRNNCDKEWIITKPSAQSVSVTFSSYTETEQYYDYIYIYDKNENQIGKYTGTALASKEITVQGDTVKIRLVSDSANTKYGFKLINVTADYLHYELGDVNLDNNLNIKDATAIQKHIAQINILSEFSISLADYDNDTRISVRDATAIQKAIVGIF